MEKFPQKKIPEISGFRLLKLLPSLWAKPLETMEKIASGPEGIVKISATKSQSIILVTHPGFVQRILKTNEKNYPRTKAIKDLKPLLGDGLLFSEGDLWEHQRQLLMPAFRQQMYAKYEETIEKELKAFVDSLKTGLPVVIDVEKTMYELMLKILFRTQLIRDASYDWQEIISHLHSFLDYASMESQKRREIKTALFKTFGILYRDNKKIKASKSIEYLRAIADDCIEKGIADESRTGISLGLMVEALKQKRTDKNLVRDEILNFIFAGFDTVAVGITWTLYGILKSGEAKAKLKSEMSVPQIINIRNSDFPYLKACIKEGLRWFPPVWSLHKTSIDDDYLGEYFIPKNSFIMLSPYLMHRNPEIWKNAEVFDPGRFLEGELKGTALSYIPFGQGSRICIGNHLATSEMRCIIGTLFSIFDLELVSQKLKYKPGIIVKLKNKFLIRICEKHDLKL